MKMKNYHWQNHIRKLRNSHPNFKKLIKLTGKLETKVPKWSNLNDAILYSIIGQMLSIKAANSIIKKLKSRFITSENILIWASKCANRKGPVCGVSQRKRKALREWYKFSNSNSDIHLTWQNSSLDDFRKEIMSIWGLGKWSADMLAIFYLGRMNVWPESDLGIKKASKIIFETENSKKIRKYVSGSETVAAIYLWQLLNKNLITHFQSEKLQKL